MTKKLLLATWIVLASLQHSAEALSSPKPLPAPTPPLGWNSWNWWGKDNINEQVVRDTIDAMAANGLRDAGYEYIVIDGGWRETTLSSDGSLRVHSEKFPSGMKALADYAHARGFKIGLHTCPGTHDCANDKVGSWGVEAVHVGQFVKWGIDFVKLDKCQFHTPGIENPTSKKDKRGGWKIGNNEEEAYTRWHDLIQESGRPIIFSASAYSFHDWYPKLTQMGRTTGDICAKKHGGGKFDGKTKVHSSVMAIAELNNESAAFAGNGYWNDPDMLITGGQGLTHEEEKAHFALWCIMTAPLMLGSDPISMSEEEMSIVANPTAIAIDQDPREQGRRISQKGTSEIWAKKRTDGTVAVLLLNRNKSQSKEISLSFDQIGLKEDQPVLDVYENTPLGTFKKNITRTIPPSSGLFILIGR